MKRLLTSTLLTGILIASTAAMAAERTVTFAVENMTCASCPYIVKKTMERVRGVTKVDVSFADKTATVTFNDSTTKPEAIAGASADAGFPAKPVRQGG